VETFYAKGNTLKSVEVIKTTDNFVISRLEDGRFAALFITDGIYYYISDDIAFTTAKVLSWEKHNNISLPTFAEPDGLLNQMYKTLIKPWI
jgi:hypothetical protein